MEHRKLVVKLGGADRRRHMTVLRYVLRGDHCIEVNNYSLLHVLIVFMCVSVAGNMTQV